MKKSILYQKIHFENSSPNEKNYLVKFLTYSVYSSKASRQGSVFLITRGFLGKRDVVDYKFTRSQQSKKKIINGMNDMAKFFDQNIKQQSYKTLFICINTKRF